MKTNNEQVKRKPWLNWVLFLSTMVIIFLLGLLASSIMERRTEAVFVYTPQVELSDWEPRNEVWGENYPKEFQSYYQTEDTTFKSKYNGNAMIDMLEVDPRLVVLWAGYGFSKDYNQGRGHYYAITDIHNTLRTGAPTGKDDGPMPTTCWTCKGPDIPRIMHDLMDKMGANEGVAEFYRGKWARWGEEIVNPIGCADCHMPYKSEGGVKYTDHKIQSPLNNVANSCQVCHRDETEKLIANVYERPDRIIENRDKLEELIVRAHVEEKFAWDKGATQEQMKYILMDIRHAQWRWDYAAASHGGSFHSPVETGRIISTGITVAQEGRIKLARLLAELGYNEEIPYPDISTKAKAQEYIGMDAEKLKSEKQEFLNTLVPQWLEKAKEREDSCCI